MTGPNISTIARRLTREQRQLIRSLETEFGTSFMAWMANDSSEFVCVHGDKRRIDADLRSLLPSLRDCESPLTLTAAAQRTFLVVDDDANTVDMHARIVQAQRSTFFCPTCQTKRA